MMKAMILKSYNQPLIMQDVSVPRHGCNEILLRVKACGICGTDLKISTGKIPTTRVPLIMGHEPMGEVVEVGSAVKDIRVGDRVAVSIYQPCYNCKFCHSGRHTLCLNLLGRTGFELNGGFAEYLCIPGVNAVKLPSNIEDNDAAILSCGVATPFHALRSRAKVGPGDTLMVMGVGGLGIHAVQIAKISGAKILAVDINEEHLGMACQFGADQGLLFDSSTFQKDVRQFAEKGVAVVFETVGRPLTIEASLKALEPGGKLVMAGYYPDIPFAVDSPQIVLKELEILGSRAANKLELTDLVSLVADGRIKPIVTGVYALDELNHVLAMLKDGKITGRVVVKP